MQIVIAENKKYIYLGIDPENEIPLTWEQMQDLKDEYFPDTVFIEVFPKKSDIINKANNRHLFHLKKSIVPSLSDLEDNMDVKRIINL